MSETNGAQNVSWRKSHRLIKTDSKDRRLRKSLQRRIQFAKQELEATRKRINALIAKNQTLCQQNQLLRSIPGLGEISCHVLLAELPDITLFGSARQLAAWAGVTPCHFVSGSSGRSTTPITKVGSANLRRALFMPAMNVRVFHPLLKTFGDRLQENGKKPKQIIIAIMRKLLHQVYGILKSGQPYHPEKRGYASASPTNKP